MYKKKHILVIDDELSWQILLQRYLENKGFAVRTVGSATEAFKILSSYKPDLIMTDIRMPDMNGFDFLLELKQQAPFTSTPVVFLSGIDDYEARKVAKSLGAVDYLVKPLNEQDIDSILSKVLL
ncbi:MAG: response regulator [Bacteroidetes bacterium]|jgi:DNA-binding response OmpR family regulator|nr:response regulator [Bacteroidota bacterium]